MMMSDTQELYIPESDITKKLDDGREVLVAPKGVPMLRSKAVTLGLIKVPQSQGPSEIKAEGDDDLSQDDDDLSQDDDDLSRRSTPATTTLPVIAVAGEGGDTGELTVDPASAIPGAVETTEPARKRKA
jgi:hypothetical protein